MTKSPTEYTSEPPKGKLVMYWGCSETVRPGQPKVVNLEDRDDRGGAGQVLRVEACDPARRRRDRGPPGLA